MSALCILTCALVSTLSAGCIENPADRLLALELQQAQIIIAYRTDCDAMGVRLRNFFTDHGQEMRSLYHKAKSRGESLGTDDSRYTEQVAKTLRAAHNARKSCRGLSAAAGYGPQFTEQL